MTNSANDVTYMVNVRLTPLANFDSFDFPLEASCSAKSTATLGARIRTHSRIPRLRATQRPSRRRPTSRRTMVWGFLLICPLARRLPPSSLFGQVLI